MKKNTVFFLICLVLIFSSCERLNEESGSHDNELSKEQSRYSSQITVETKKLCSFSNEKIISLIIGFEDGKKILVRETDKQTNYNDYKITFKYMDINGANVISEMKYQMFYDNNLYSIYKSGTLFLIDVDKKKRRIVFSKYDKDLKLINSYDITSHFSISMLSFYKNFDISSSGKTLLWQELGLSGNSGGIKELDIGTNSNKLLLKTNLDEIDKLYMISKSYYTFDDKRIIFSGSLYKGKTNGGNIITETVFGYMNSDGSDLNYKKNDYADSNVKINKNCAALNESGGNNPQSRTIAYYGNAFFINPKKSEIKTLKLNNIKESANVYVSDDGSYIITYLNKNDNDEKKPIITIYDTQTNNTVKKITVENCEEIFDLPYINEQQNTLYVSYNINNENVLYQYPLY